MSEEQTNGEQQSDEDQNEKFNWSKWGFWLAVLAILLWVYQTFYHESPNLAYEILSNEENKEEIIISNEYETQQLTKRIAEQTEHFDTSLAATKKKIIENQSEIKGQIDELNKIEVANIKSMVLASVLDGSKIVADPKEFKFRSSAPGSGHEKRKKSWTNFKRAKKLANRDIVIELSNYSEESIWDVELNVKWNSPTYIVDLGLGLGGDIEKFKVYNTFYYQNPFSYQINEDLKNHDDPSEWARVRYGSDFIRLAKVEPKENIRIVLRRITSENFLKKPDLELRFRTIRDEEISKKMENNQ